VAAQRFAKARRYRHRIPLDHEVDVQRSLADQQVAQRASNYVHLVLAAEPLEQEPAEREPFESAQQGGGSIPEHR
jgi:hypothetical protein